MSGITSLYPLFGADRITETLTGGYFAILGTLTRDPQGLLMLGRWRMINMFYHIIDLKDREDLVQLLLGNMDFTMFVKSDIFDMDYADLKAEIAIYVSCSRKH